MNFRFYICKIEITNKTHQNIFSPKSQNTFNSVVCKVKYISEKGMRYNFYIRWDMKKKMIRLNIKKEKEY